MLEDFTTVREGTFLNVEYLFFKVYTFFVRLFGGDVGGVQGGWSTDSSGWGGGWLDSLGAIGSFLFWFFCVVACILLCIYIYSHSKHSKEESRRTDMLHKRVHDLIEASHTKEPSQSVPSRFSRLQARIDAGTEADWKLAIIEADSIVDEITKALKLSGDTMGERMKSAHESTWRTLQDAWEVHKIRNTIAHSPDFVLTEREAKRILSLYVGIFREFDLIE
jgi:hypothetical protein